MKGKENPETAIQRTIMDHLERLRIFAYRNNTGIAFNPGSNRPIRFGPKGASDIIAIVEGRYVAFEVKRIGSFQTSDQIDWQDKIERAGGFYFVVRSPEDVDAALRQVYGRRAEVA